MRAITIIMFLISTSFAPAADKQSPVKDVPLRLASKEAVQTAYDAVFKRSSDAMGKDQLMRDMGVRADKMTRRGMSMDANPIPSRPKDVTEFISLLKTGQTFDIPGGSVEIPCSLCLGRGRVEVKRLPRVGDGKEPCKACKGVGRLNVSKITRYRW